MTDKQCEKLVKAINVLCAHLIYLTDQLEGLNQFVSSLGAGSEMQKNKTQEGGMEND